jgi:hypothetical protein
MANDDIENARSLLEGSEQRLRKVKGDIETASTNEDQWQSVDKE